MLFCFLSLFLILSECVVVRVSSLISIEFILDYELEIVYNIYYDYKVLLHKSGLYIYIVLELKFLFLKSKLQNVWIILVIESNCFYLFIYFNFLKIVCWLFITFCCPCMYVFIVSIFIIIRLTIFLLFLTFCYDSSNIST